MDVNCCPRNDFSFPMKNSSKDLLSSWPTHGSNEHLFDQENSIFHNTSNFLSLESSCILPFQQLDLNTPPSHPFSFNPQEILPFGFSHQRLSIPDENIRPTWLISSSQPTIPDESTETIRHWIGDFSTETNNEMHQIPLLSQKVFIGGVPRFATETDIHANFDRFGVFEIQWPKLHGGHKEQHRENGFFHIVFHNAKSVCTLLDHCSRQSHSGICTDYFIHFETATGSRKTVEIIPWNIGDNNYALRPPQQLDSKKTIFVGNLHGTMTARYLWRLMEDLFGGVVYAGVDIDKYKYPIGSGRVTFDNSSSFLHAVSTAFVDVRTPRFLKRLQIEPHLQYRFCSLCKLSAGDLFCRNFTCFDYFCQRCWQKIHVGSMSCHKAVTRHSKSSQPVFHPTVGTSNQPF